MQRQVVWGDSATAEADLRGRRTEVEAQLGGLFDQSREWLQLGAPATNSTEEERSRKRKQNRSVSRQFFAGRQVQCSQCREGVCRATSGGHGGVGCGWLQRCQSEIIRDPELAKVTPVEQRPWYSGVCGVQPCYLEQGAEGGCEERAPLAYTVFTIEEPLERCKKFDVEQWTAKYYDLEQPCLVMREKCEPASESGWGWHIMGVLKDKPTKETLAQMEAKDHPNHSIPLSDKRERRPIQHMKKRQDGGQHVDEEYFQYLSKGGKDAVTQKWNVTDEEFEGWCQAGRRLQLRERVFAELFTTADRGYELSEAEWQQARDGGDTNLGKCHRKIMTFNFKSRGAPALKEVHGLLERQSNIERLFSSKRQVCARFEGWGHSSFTERVRALEIWHEAHTADGWLEEFMRTGETFLDKHRRDHGVWHALIVRISWFTPL
jgi:hypothetical protein